MKPFKSPSNPSSYSISKNFEQPVDVVWKFISESENLAEWLFDNDFVAEVGSSFRFWLPPQDSWDGILHGRVTSVVNQKSLSYNLNSSSLNGESNLEWRLEKGPGKTLLSLTHEGDQEIIDRFYDLLAEQHEEDDNCDPKTFISAVENLVSSDPVKANEIVDRYIAMFPDKSADIMEAAARAGGANFLRLVAHSLLILTTGSAVVLESAEAKQTGSEELEGADESKVNQEAENPLFKIHKPAQEAFKNNVALQTGSENTTGSSNLIIRPEGQSAALYLGFLVQTSVQENPLLQHNSARQGLNDAGPSGELLKDGLDFAEDTNLDVRIPLNVSVKVSKSDVHLYEHSEWKLIQSLSDWMSDGLKTLIGDDPVAIGKLDFKLSDIFGADIDNPGGSHEEDNADQENRQESLREASSKVFSSLNGGGLSDAGRSGNGESFAGQKELSDSGAEKNPSHNKGMDQTANAQNEVGYFDYGSYSGSVSYQNLDVYYYESYLQSYEKYQYSDASGSYLYESYYHSHEKYWQSSNSHHFFYELYVTVERFVTSIFNPTEQNSVYSVDADSHDATIYRVGEQVVVQLDHGGGSAHYGQYVSINGQYQYSSNTSVSTNLDSGFSSINEPTIDQYNSPLGIA